MTTQMAVLARMFAEVELRRRKAIADLLSAGGRVLYEDGDSIVVLLPPAAPETADRKDRP